MVSYPARLTRSRSGYRASFPDLPEAVATGATPERALTRATDALLGEMGRCFKARRKVPRPSAPASRNVPVVLPASVAVKLLLLNELVEQELRNVELARRMRTTSQEVGRLTNLRHRTKIDALVDALQVLGRRLELALA